MKLAIGLILIASGVVAAQALSFVVAKPEDQAVIKPLIAASRDATRARNAKAEKLPEAKTVATAQTALTTAALKLPETKAVADARALFETAAAKLPEAKALRDAQAALEAAAAKIPEDQTLKQANAALLDAAFKAMARHQLSSRDYMPQINEKGELVFTKIAK